jgi:hypothetical protein
MKTRNAALAAVLALTCAAPCRASKKAAAQVAAAKGPVQITLRLDSTTVKVGKSLWYKIELKNIGKKKLRVDDWIFKDPWAMHHNCLDRHGIYLEVIAPDATPLWVQRGGGELTWDYARNVGDKVQLTPEEKKELEDLEADAKKRGLTAQQKSLALDRWNDGYHLKKQLKELTDPAKQRWLPPGASTSTFAWAFREPIQDEFTDHSYEEPQVADFTQLWSYFFATPGKYRIRAVYDNTQPESTKAMFKQHKHPLDPGWVKAKTPFVEFQVIP